jgi:hypothetical protein
MGLDSPMTPRELEAWAQHTVSLFLGGCPGLSGKPSRHTSRPRNPNA